MSRGKCPHCWSTYKGIGHCFVRISIFDGSSRGRLAEFTANNTQIILLGSGPSEPTATHQVYVAMQLKLIERLDRKALHVLIILIAKPRKLIGDEEERPVHSGGH